MHKGTHLRFLSESYPMYTNMTGFQCFAKFLHPCASDDVASALEGLTQTAFPRNPVSTTTDIYQPPWPRMAWSMMISKIPCFHQAKNIYNHVIQINHALMINGSGTIFLRLTAQTPKISPPPPPPPPFLKYFRRGKPADIIFWPSGPHHPPCKRKIFLTFTSGIVTDCILIVFSSTWTLCAISPTQNCSSIQSGVV